jgi:DNA-binding beta-propeller fold protein YncE
MCFKPEKLPQGTGEAASHRFPEPLGGWRRSCCSVFLVPACLAFSAWRGQADTFALRTTMLLEGPAAGNDSVVLVATPASAAWMAAPNADWLHLGPAYQSGTGSTNVVFSFDANPGATRTGTVTIAGQTLNVTQAGSSYIAAGLPCPLVSAGLSDPAGVALDQAGNVYIADTGHYAIKEWVTVSNTMVTLVSTGLYAPQGLAVDGAGNVYIADTEHNAIKEWTPANSNVVTLVSSGLNQPYGVAVDGAGNVFIADTGDYAIKEWVAANSNVVTQVSSGLYFPINVAVDCLGNVYFADGEGDTIKEWTAASSNVVTLVSSGLSGPDGLAVDGSGNVYIANEFDNTIKKWVAASGTMTTLPSSGLHEPLSVAVDGAGNVFIADTDNNAIKELPRVYVDPTDRREGLAAGGDALPVVLPATANLSGPFAPTSEQPWLSITGITNGVVSFSFTASATNRTGYIDLLGQRIPVTQGALVFTYALGTTALLEGPGGGGDSVVLTVNPYFGPWAATANADWLHLNAANQSGTGCTNVVFSFDANPGGTRSGSLSIAGQTLTITQAGSTYVAAGLVAPLVSSGLSGPVGVAVDGAGNVFIADTWNNAIKEWMAARNNVTTLVSSGLNQPQRVAVDAAGNVYVADLWNYAIKEYTPPNSNVVTLVTGLSLPVGVAVDGAGDVYIADMANGAIDEWTVANSNLVTLISLGLNNPNDVAVDRAGNVYIADSGNGAIKEWIMANSNVVALVFSGLNNPEGVAVDSGGNVYICDTGNQVIKKWTVASGTVTALVSTGLLNPGSVAVDSAGNVYIADSGDSAIKELPHAYVDTSDRLESLEAGNDALPVVLPATANLSVPFAPNSEQPWLTITGVTNGVVSFSFTASGTNRTGYIDLLGQRIPVTQGALVFTYALGTTALLEGSGAGNDSVVLGVNPYFGPWAATANADWLHLSPANQSGTGSTNVVFSFDANPGATRSGSLTIAGQTLTVTQAGSTYVPSGPVTTLLSSGLNGPEAVAVDNAGNVYIVDTLNAAIKKWTVASNTVTTLVSSGLYAPAGVAVDAVGNVYIADTGNNAIKKWIAASSNVVTLISSGLNEPYGVAVDGAGNVFIADTRNGQIKEWMPDSSNLVTLVSSGLNWPFGVAVDAAGNVYIADTYNNAVKEWTAATLSVSTLVSSGLNQPMKVAVDGAGNVYIADTFNNAVQEWTPANNSVTTLVSSALLNPWGLAADGAGNVYIADTGNGAIKELPRVFVDPTGRLESEAAGSDALPVVLPLTANLLAPFTPVSEASWLNLGSLANGVVNFAFTATVSNRTGYITLLGQSIPVTQGSGSSVLSATQFLVGPGAGTDRVFLAVAADFGPWMATANASWLHLNPGNQNSTGSATIPFSYDANSGATRAGTLTIAGQTLTVTQAGSTYVRAGLVPLVTLGLNQPYGVAVDGAGNVYIANTGSNAVVEWTTANNTATTLVSSGLNQPYGVAVDGAGNVYIADTGNNSLKEWTAAGSNVTTLVSSGLSSPVGVAVNGAGNLYVADNGWKAVAVKEWTVANGSLNTLASVGLTLPTGIAVDAAGNAYISDYGNTGIDGGGVIEQWPVTVDDDTVSTLVSGLNYPSGVAVDTAGNVYFALAGNAGLGNGAIWEWVAAEDAVTILVGSTAYVASGLNNPHGLAVDGAGNVYLADTGNNAVRELPYAFVDPTPRSETGAAGSDALPVVLPATISLAGPLAPASDQPWLTITGVTNGVVSFSFTVNTGASRTANVSLLGQTIPITQSGPSFFLGTTARWEGPTAGSDSVVLAVVPQIATWTASANATWLHLGPANQSGTGSTNVVFSFDANSGATRTGTLTIGGQKLTVTQAGSTYVVAGPLTTLVSSNVSFPEGVAVDGSGNVYIADTWNNAVEEWTATNNTLVTLVSSGLNRPEGVAVDGAGNVYIADTENDAIKEWTAASDTVATLVSAGLNRPQGVAVDSAGNVFIADTGHSAIKEWTAANSNVVTLVSSGLDFPTSVAVDRAGNLYIADTFDNAIKEWVAANNTLVTLASSALGYLCGVAVDGAGNVYFADADNLAIEQWLAASNTVITLVSTGLAYPCGLAVDGTGNVYIADAGNSAIQELPHAFVDSTARWESANAGSDVLPAVLPPTINLLGPFTPTSDQPWLTMGGITNGVVTLCFAANLGSSRTGHISLLGQTINVTQGGLTFSLGTTARWEGPAAGSDSVVLAVVPQIATWTAASNSAWLHLTPANQAGMGSTNVVFSFDANPGATRTGSLTIASQALTVTQAGSTYVATGPLTTLASSGLASPHSVAVDAAGNVYIANTGHNSILEWMVANGQVTTRVASGLNQPRGLAVDGSGNIYIADTYNNAVKEWMAAGSNVTTLVSSGLSTPSGVAVDGTGNVYIADTGHSVIKKWTPANNTVTTLVSAGLIQPQALAVDAAGNVYIADSGHNMIKEWTAANSTVTPLVSAGLVDPTGVAVDGAGNVFIADTGHNAIKEWTASGNTVTTLVASGLVSAYGVAVDGTGNVYIADNGGAIRELPYAFVDPTEKLEGAGSGQDSLPAVLPTMANLLAPFSPTSDKPWLTLSGITNGLVSFSFAVNPGSSRTAHISLLGQTIPVTQGAPPTLIGAQMLGNGVFQFSFSNLARASFTVLSTTNLTLPLSNWTVVGAATNIGAGLYQFASEPRTNDPQRFFRTRSP